MPLLRILFLTLALLGTAAGSAGAAQRYVSQPGVSSGDCSALTPCSLTYAINSAPDNSEVIVPSGDYPVTSQLIAPGPLTLRGTGATRPRIVSTQGTLTVLEVKNGGSVRNLEIDASGTGQDAMTLEGVLGEHLVAKSATGDGAKLVGSPALTVLRDSLVTSNGTGSASALKLRDGPGQAGGDLAVVNVTVSAPATTAVRCETQTGQSTLTNTIVRGGAVDIGATLNGVRCATDHSNYRQAVSPGVAAGPGNVDADPAFADAALRLSDASPLVNAGRVHPTLLGTADLDGRQRVVGAKPDIGAFENPNGPAAAPAPEGAPLEGAPTPAPSPAPSPAPAPSPVPSPTPDATPVTVENPGTALVSDEQAKQPDADGDGTPDATDLTPSVPAAQIGRTVVVAPSRGRVIVRPPGAKGFTPLDGSTFVPTGSVIDTRRGTVALTSALGASGAVQTGTFRGGLFEVRQSRTGKGMTDIVLRGGDFSRCPKAGTAAVSAKRKAPKRSVWAKDDKGRFRTHGRNSVATARGTAWLTEDTCAGTRTKVSKDAVSVQPTRGGKATTVRAGHELLVRHRPR